MDSSTSASSASSVSVSSSTGDTDQQSLEDLKTQLQETAVNYVNGGSTTGWVMRSVRFGGDYYYEDEIPADSPYHERASREKETVRITMESKGNYAGGKMKFAAKVYNGEATITSIGIGDKEYVY